MPGLIRNKALGLIETVGLVGAIEAADAAAKAADVVISAAEVIDPALVTLKIFGELGAVQAAVDAGSRAAQRVGQLLASHVIPNPDNELDIIMGGKYALPRPAPPRRSRTPARATRPSPPRLPERKLSRDTDKPDIENMSVTQLRQYARMIPNLAIKGREISRADRQTLLREIRTALERREG
jgi:microcompartment protein CcmL/EutN